MQFTPASIDQTLKGLKRKTRRPFREGDKSTTGREGVAYVEDKNGRLKWRLGNTYAIQPGRGRKGIEGHRIKIIGIQCEKLGDISPTDAMAEGLVVVAPAGGGCDGIYGYGRDPEKGHDIMWTAPSITEAYIEMYQSMHPKAKREDLVWVLEFDLVKS